MTLQSLRQGKLRIWLAILAGLVFATTPTLLNAQELLGYWPLEETDEGADVLDLSGNGFHGSFEGDVDPNVEGAPGFGSGAFFDGVTGQVYIGPGDENGFGDLTEDFTVMAWINPENFGHKNRVFGSAPHGGAGFGWGTVGDQLELTTWGIKDYDQGASLEEEEWAHAAIVLDDDFEAHFYLNGEFIGSQPHPSPGNPTANDFYIGFACCDAEHFEGRIDEVALFSGQLTEEQIKNAMTLGVLNFDGNVDPWAVLDDGSLTDPTERANYIHDVLHSWVGDSNKDREFNSSDFVQVFAAGEYEDAIPSNSTWEEGDWNGDHDFDSSDFVAAFTDGGYELGMRPGMRPAAAAAVPEPASIQLISIALIGLFRFRRK
ncbi:MAG: LamG domain-containing protein [Planctomycetales bacterium]|nr:LamG domain-containing protein [Planctomycetales bacterium]